MPWLGALSAICGMLLSVVVFAQSVPEVPPDPWEVIHIARESGAAEVTRDKLRDPVINAQAQGIDYDISFYGCYLGRECTSILFRADLYNLEWDGEHPEVGIIDEWNAEKLFGRAILSDSGHAILEHPVAMGAGLSRDAMRASFSAWLTALEEFVDHVDFK